MYTLCFDGLFRPAVNPEAHIRAGVMCYGWVIYKDQAIIARGHGASAHSFSATSNVAEYLALIAGLEALQDLRLSDGDEVEILGDSRTVIDQLTGYCGMHTPYLRPLYRKACAIAQQLPIRKMGWISREQNKDADVLTRRALMQVSQNREKYQETIRSIDPRSKDRGEQRRGFINLIDLRAMQPMMA